MSNKQLKTYQAYYVDVPIIQVKRYFVRSATSKEDAIERVANYEGINPDETKEVRNTMQEEGRWNAQPSDKVELLDKESYELR